MAETLRFSGEFSIAPVLSHADRLLLVLYLEEDAGERGQCPWAISTAGDAVMPREAVTESEHYDTWLWSINQWLETRAYELTGLVRFRGADPGDEGVLTYDGRHVLMRL